MTPNKKPFKAPFGRSPGVVFVSFFGRLYLYHVHHHNLQLRKVLSSAEKPSFANGLGLAGEVAGDALFFVGGFAGFILL